MNTKQIVIFGNLLLILLIANILVFQKEQVVKHGDIVCLELAPVDPRSIMQGDYISLGYKIQTELALQTQKRGYVILTKNDSNLVIAQRIATSPDSLVANQVLLKFVTVSGQIDFGCDAYFFQEGNAEVFANAKYGGIKTNAKGNCVLIGLFDEKLNPIVP